LKNAKLYLKAVEANPKPKRRQTFLNSNINRSAHIIPKDKALSGSINASINAIFRTYSSRHPKDDNFSLEKDYENVNGGSSDPFRSKTDANKNLNNLLEDKVMQNIQNINTLLQYRYNNYTNQVLGRNGSASGGSVGKKQKKTSVIGNFTGASPRREHNASNSNAEYCFTDNHGNSIPNHYEKKLSEVSDQRFPES
jgi:hypothetical protein